MKFIYRLRQFGKTTELLNIALDLAEQGKEVVFVAPTVAMAKYTHEMFEKMLSVSRDHAKPLKGVYSSRSNMQIRFNYSNGLVSFVGYENYKLMQSPFPTEKIVLVDNMDLIMEKIFNAKVEAVSWNKDAHTSDVRQTVQGLNEIRRWFGDNIKGFGPGETILGGEKL
jgi:hypothetical protein